MLKCGERCNFAAANKPTKITPQNSHRAISSKAASRERNYGDLYCKQKRKFSTHDFALVCQFSSTDLVMERWRVSFPYRTALTHFSGRFFTEERLGLAGGAGVMLLFCSHWALFTSPWSSLASQTPNRTRCSLAVNLHRRTIVFHSNRAAFGSNHHFFL